LVSDIELGRATSRWVETTKPSAKPQREVLAKSVEVKGTDALERRPRLAETLAEARKAKAPVVVAKLCRLSRDVAFNPSSFWGAAVASADRLTVTWGTHGFLSLRKSIRLYDGRISCVETAFLPGFRFETAHLRNTCTMDEQSMLPFHDMPINDTTDQ
jgi:hypothetical protein